MWLWIQLSKYQSTLLDIQMLVSFPCMLSYGASLIVISGGVFERCVGFSSKSVTTGVFWGDVLASAMAAVYC